MSKVLNKLRNFQKTQLGQDLYEKYLYNYQTFTHRFKLNLAKHFPLLLINCSDTARERA